MRKADNLPPPCAVVTKYGNLNFLEPSGPFWVCNGTALPFSSADRDIAFGVNYVGESVTMSRFWRWGDDT